MTETALTYWLNTTDDLPSAAELGGKGRNLIELVRLNQMVPRGFIISASLFRHVLLSGGVFHIYPKAAERVQQLRTLEQQCADLERRVSMLSIPPKIESHLIADFDRLGAERVAVRSSYGGEDGKGSSYAGVFHSLLNVDREGYLTALRRCWSSLFNPTVFAYEGSSEFYSLDRLSFAVVVQELVVASVSGACLSRSSIEGSDASVDVEAVFGMGQALLSGSVTPDFYTVDERSRTVTSRRLTPQTQMLVPSPMPGGGLIWESIHPEKAATAKLTDSTLSKLAVTTKGLERVMGYECEVEWAMAKGVIYVLQCRPMTASH